MALYYVGLDYHLKTSTAAILDADGKVVERRTIGGHWRKMVEHLRQFKQRRGDQTAELAICFEASCGYGALHDELAALAQRIIVAHPGKLRLIFQSKRKNDRVDAQKLALLLMLNEVPAVHVPDLDVRAWREMIQFRRTQVDARTRIKNQIRTLLRSHGITASGGLWSNKGRQWLEQVPWPTALAKLRCEILLEQLDQARGMVQKVTKELDRIAERHPGVGLLQTIPGVGPRTSEAVVAWIDQPHRFGRTSRIGAYFGLTPSQNASATVNRLGHITKQGPATVRKLLTEAAWRCIDRQPSMRAWFDRITGGKKDRRKIALIAVAHKLTRIMLAMLRSGEVFDARRLGGEDSAPRLEKQHSPQPPIRQEAEAAEAAAV